MTDISPAEAIEEILGVPIEDRPPQAEPCWEEKNGSAVSVFDPDDDQDGMKTVLRRLDQIAADVMMIREGVNQIGGQTSWLVNAFHEARTAFMTMSAELSAAGPMGLLKMISGKSKGKKEASDNDAAH